MPNEKKYETILKRALEGEGWFYRKLHGNLYQMGLPDVLLGRPSDGEIILLEMKGSRKTVEEMPMIAMFELLHGPQVGVMLMLWKIKARTGICLGTPNGFFIAFPPYSPDKIILPLACNEVVDTLAQI